MHRYILFLITLAALLVLGACSEEPVTNPVAADKASTGHTLDPEELIDTRILDGEADPEFTDDPMVYPYYIVRHGPEAGTYSFNSGDTVPDGAYVVLKAHTWSEEPAPQNFNLQGMFSAVGDYNNSGVQFSFATTYSRQDLKPTWSDPHRGLAADTLGFEVGPFDYEVSMRGLLNMGQSNGVRDQSADVLTFKGNFPPCVQNMELINLQHEAEATTEIDDCVQQEDLDEEILLQAFFAADSRYLPDENPGHLTNMDRISSIYVDPVSNRIRLDEPQYGEWLEIQAFTYRSVIYLHGRDHLQEVHPLGNESDRIGAWSYQVDHAADPDNLLREGPGTDNIDLTYSMNRDEIEGTPWEDEAFISTSGIWGLTLTVKVPIFLALAGEEGHWNNLLMMNAAPPRPEDPAEWPAWQQEPTVILAKNCWDLTTMVFGPGSVQAIAWDQPPCELDHIRGSYHFYDKTRNPTPNGRHCEDGAYTTPEISERGNLPLENFRAPSNDGVSLVKPFHLVCEILDGTTFEGQVPPPGWVDAKVLERSTYHTHR